MPSAKGMFPATCLKPVAILFAAMFVMFCGGVEYAWAAQSATTTTLTVTSGGVAVTEVPATTVVTLTATVNAGSMAVQLGTVNFCDASAKSCTDIHLLGTAQLTQGGTAAMKFRPGIGSHSYKAVFLRTKGNAASASATAALTVTGQAATGVYPTTTAIAQSGDPEDYALTATVTGPNGIASPTGTVSFLDTSDENSVLDTATLGAGTPGFSWLNTLHVDVGNNPKGIAAADFNGDGIVDIALADGWDTDVPILLGNGDGTFTAKSSVEVGGGSAAIAVADFNGDGIPDLAITCPRISTINVATCPVVSTVNIYLGNGDGTFTAKSSLATGSWPNSVVVADFNGDGILDLAVANAPDEYGGPLTPYLTILLGNGDGTFTAAPNAPAPGEPWVVSVGDFNGDGIPDLAFSNSYASNNSVSILLGNGDGTFTAAPGVATGNGNNDVLVGDFNGDGKLDLALVYLDGHGNTILKMMMGNGDGTFTATPTSPITFPYSAGIWPGDFNGDGILDLAVMNDSDDTASYLLGNGNGAFTATVASPPLIGPLPDPHQRAGAAAADVNGDGLSDLIVTQFPVYTVTLRVWLTQQMQTATATASGIPVVGPPVTHQIDASYPGDVNHQGSTSGTVGLTPLIGTATHFSVTAPSNVGAYVPFTITATALDASGSTMTAYAGTVSFTSSDGSAVLPAASKLTAGIGSFPVALKTQGNQTITATDSTNSLTGTSAAIGVGAMPPGVFAEQDSLNVGSQAVGSPSGTQTLSFRIGAATTVGSIAVVTQGAANLDFINATGGTCTATTYSSATNCTVNVTFKPRAVGARYGAVVFTDGSGNLLANVYLQGTGVGPLAVFADTTSGGYLPSKQTYLASGSVSPNCVAVDASGNLFITDGYAVKEILAVNGSIPASPTIKTLGSGFAGPYCVAVDGSGNVFVADRNADAVKEIVAVGGYTTVKTLGDGFGFGGPNGVAVDGSGNVFIADWVNSAVYEILAAGGYTTVKNLVSGSFQFADYVSVDGNGNVFVADFGNGAVKEIMAAGGYTTVKTLKSGLSDVSSVAVDASGNLFVTLWGNGTAYEIVAAGGYTTIHALSSGYTYLNSVAVDASGNVLIPDGAHSRVVKLDYADPPSLTFAKTSVGVESSDSPQTVTVSNNGNADLTFPVPAAGNNPSISSGYTLAVLTTCPELSASSSAGTLAAGANCDYAVDFIPVAGADHGSLILTDNNLNASPAVTQAVPLTGLINGRLAFTTPPSTALLVGWAPGTVAVGVEDANDQLITTSSATVTLTVTGPSSYSKVYTATASSGIATFSSLAWLTTVGSYTYTATDTPDGLTQAVAPVTVFGPPSVVSESPSSGFGTTQQFSFMASSPNGAGDLAFVNMVFNTMGSPVNGCDLAYVAAGNQLSLLSDDHNTSTSGQPGATGALSNSQCSVNLSATTVTASGNTLTLAPTITFKSGFKAGLQIYMFVQDFQGENTGWKTMGWWMVGSLPESAPSAVSVSPSSGFGTTQQFNFVASSPNGAGNLAFVNMVFNTMGSPVNGCDMTYVAAGNQLSLLSDDHSTSTSGQPGATGTLSNSQCSVNLSATTVTAIGNTLTVAPTITFKSGFKAGIQIYMYVQDIPGMNSGWKTMGWWMVGSLAEQPPSAVSVSPSSGFGTTEQFSFVASSPNGAGNLAEVKMLFNTTLYRVNGCYLTYLATGNQLSLLSDDGTTSTSGQPGATGTLSNSQCSVNLSATTVTASGNTLTVAPTITFTSGFNAGTQAYMYVADVPGMNSGWKKMSP